jgi:hypothetical protein
VSHHSNAAHWSLTLAALVGGWATSTAADMRPIKADDSVTSKAESPYYAIEDLPAPPSGDILEVGCLQQLPGDRLAVGTRRGVILIAHNVSSPDPSKITWTVFARGLWEPLGMQWRDNALYVIQKPELTKIQDLNGTGVADHFETVTDRWGYKGNYHEFAFCSPPDKEGATWIGLCLTGSFTSEDLFRGWALRLFPDGRLEPAAAGLRSPGGMGADADGNIYYTDNEGRWHGSSCLALLTPGSFHGTYNGNVWYSKAPKMGPEPIPALPESRIEAERKRVPQLVPPAVILPHGIVGRSPSGIVCDTTGAMGPFKNQLFLSEQTFSNVQRVYVEKVNGVAQGMVVPYCCGLSSGPIALQILASGMLYTGGTNRGWASRGLKGIGLQRIRYTGLAPFEIDHMNITQDGFDVRFTEAVDSSAEKTASYKMSAWCYIYHEAYGSPRVDIITPEVTAAKLAADGLSVHLTVKGWRQGSVHELAMPGVRSKKGAPLLHDTTWYTINEIPHDAK